MERGLVGHPLGHSYSKGIHESINNKEYHLFDLDYEAFNEFINKKEFSGINVTIPYKEKVIKYLDYIHPKARKIGAVNTVVNIDGKLYGYNTDYSGFKFLVKYNNINFTNKNVLILGTGGTSKTVYAVVKDLHCANVNKVTTQKDTKWLRYEDLIEGHPALENTDIIINTTPVGMYPDLNNQPIDLKKFKKLEAVVDVIYNPYKTQLLLDAKELGIKYVGGLLMLVAQAVYAAEIFDNVENVNYYDRKELILSIYKKLLFNSVNIVLIGMPGSGKSTMGKMLAEELGLTIYDLDDAFKYKYKKTASTIIKELGNEEFRKMETEIVKEFSGLKNSVIATGGGVVTIEENYDYFKHNSIIIYIKRKPLPKTLKKNRPLSQDLDAWERLYQERSELYLKWKDYQVEGMYRKVDTLKKVLNIFK